MTVPFPFVANAVLTAAQLNAITSLPTTAKTASATLTAAESVGYRVTMTSASATTITINTGVFATGDTVFITNLGTGICTVTAGTATVSSAGPLAIPQYGSGVLVMTATGSGIWYPSAASNEIAYGQRTSDVNVTATSAAAATDLGITTGAATYDGTAVVLQFSAAAVDKGTSAIYIALYDGASLVVDRLCQTNSTGAQALNGFYRFTPSAGSHTYLVKGWVDAGTGTIYAGTTRVPAFCRVTRA